MERFCGFAHYKHEDLKMRHFVLSLEGDAKNWFYGFLNNSFDSLQVVVNAFPNIYGDQRDSPCSNYNVKDESDSLKDPTIIDKFQENAPHKYFPYFRPCEHFHDESTHVVARRIIDSGKVGTNDQIHDEKENDKHIIKELTQMLKDIQFSQSQLMKTMELSQENHA